MTVRAAAIETTVRAAARAATEMTVRAAARAVSGMTVRAVRADSPASTVTGTAGTAEAPDPDRDSVPRAARQPADAPLSDRMPRTECPSRPGGRRPQDRRRTSRGRRFCRR